MLGFQFRKDRGIFEFGNKVNFKEWSLCKWVAEKIRRKLSLLKWMNRIDRIIKKVIFIDYLTL